MGHSLEGSRIKVMVGDNFSVGYVVRRISREIVYSITVLCLGFTVHMKHRQLGMLG